MSFRVRYWDPDAPLTTKIDDEDMFASEDEASDYGLLVYESCGYRFEVVEVSEVVKRSAG